MEAFLKTLRFPQTAKHVIPALRIGLAATFAFGLASLFLVVLVSPLKAQEGSETPIPDTLGRSETSTPPLIGQGSAVEPPSTPGRPSVTGISHNSISLSWRAESGATHYDARYRNRDAGGRGVPGSWSQTSGISGTSQTFSGLSPSTRYVFEIRAGNAGGDSSWSPIRYGTTTSAPIPLSLPVPSNRTLTKDVFTSFTLPVARGGTAPYKHSVSGLPAGLSFTASSRTVSGEPSAIGTSTVTYIVTDSASASDRKTFTITVTTSPVPSAPGRPSVTGTTQTSVSLSWGAVTGATHYDARYRNRDAGGADVPGTWSQTDNIQGTTQTFSGLTPGTRYEFEVRAGNAAGSSAWSLVRYGTTKPSTIMPTTPTGSLSASPSTIFIGEEVTLDPSDVTPSNTQVKLVYDTKLTHRGSCPEIVGQSTHNTVTLASPDNPVTFIGCWPGTAGVSLRTVSGDALLDSVSIRIETPSVEMSELVSSLPQGDPETFSYNFKVTASNLSSTVTYSIKVLAGDADLGFDAACSQNTASSGSLSGSPPLSNEFTLHACHVGGARVFASVLHGNRTIASTNKFVRVTKQPPPVDSGPAPPPTVDRKPAAPGNLTFEIGGTKGLVKLDWSSSARVERYTVEHWKPNSRAQDFRWRELGTGDVRIDFPNSRAEVSNLDPENIARLRVVAHNSHGTATSAEIRVNLRAAPGKPTGVYEQYRKIKLTWDPVLHATGYIVEQHHPVLIGPDWRALPFNPFTVTIPTLNSTGKMQAIVGGLTDGVSYKHRIRAITPQTPEGTATDASEYDTTVVNDERPTGAPSDLKAVDIVGGRGIRIMWEDTNVQNEDGYIISHTPSTSTIVVDVSTPLKAEFLGVEPGTSYTFTVRARNAAGLGPAAKETRKAPTPAYWWGHQADHTVKYAKGTISNSFIKGAIKLGAEAWNTMMGHGLLICDDESMGISCNSRMMDGGIVTIKTVATTRDTPSAGCGKNSMACVIKDGDGDPPASPALAPGRHMLDMDMVFEAPGFSCPKDDDECDNADQLRIFWTNDSGKHGMAGLNGSDEVYVYVNYIVIHEFGHTLGMPDFYRGGGADVYDDRLANETPAIMNSPSDAKRVRDKDLEQLNAIYRRHTRQ